MHKTPFLRFIVASLSVATIALQRPLFTGYYPVTIGRIVVCLVVVAGLQVDMLQYFIFFPYLMLSLAFNLHTVLTACVNEYRNLMMHFIAIEEPAHHAPTFPPPLYLLLTKSHSMHRPVSLGMCS
jgi:hypothetical protein